MYQLFIQTLDNNAVKPRVGKMYSTDDVTTISTAGYLNPAAIAPQSLENSDLLDVLYSYDAATNTGQHGRFSVSISGGVITLTEDIAEGNVEFPVTANHIAVFKDATGVIKDDVATAINAGNLQAGLSGTAGAVMSYPSAASKGHLSMTAVANTGNTVTTISNAAMGQASVISIPDPGQATSEFIIADSAGTQHITSGNFEVDAGNVIAGSDANAGHFESHPATTNSGTLRVTAVDSSADVVVTISNADHAQATVVSIPDGGQATTEFIIADSAGTQHISSGSLEVDLGNIIAGSDSNAGHFESHPATTGSGTLRLVAADSAGDFIVSISNSSHAQASVVSIPDGGQATTEFIIADSAGIQHITSGSLEVDLGNLIVGSDANAGYVESHPTTTNSGTLRLAAVDAGADVIGTISNSAIAQATTWHLVDPVQTNGYVQVSPTASDPCSNLMRVQVTVTAAALAVGGVVALVTSSGSKQYKINEIFMNGGGTDFSGGGGDRLLDITDGTTIWTSIAAAQIQATQNARWGDTHVPYPSGYSLSDASAAGTTIRAIYSGGATDYAAGSIIFTIFYERVA